VQGLQNDKKPKDLEDKMHPLGFCRELSMMMKDTWESDEQSLENAYRVFLIDTPVGPYFEEYLKSVDIDPDGESTRLALDPKDVRGLLQGGENKHKDNKGDPEIMKATLKKFWLEDFHKTVMAIGGTTGEVLGHILKKEADFRILMVTLNALNTDLGSEANSKLQRNPLYPHFGYLYPEGVKSLIKAWNEASVREALAVYPQYAKLYEDVKALYEAEGDKAALSGQNAIEDKIYKENVEMYEMAFEQQFHFGVIYAWVKLKEQEIRNIRWIANMITLGMAKDRTDSAIVQIFKPRT